MRPASVIVSLWSVYDPSTKELMVEFYKQLKSGKDKATALQQDSNKDNEKRRIFTSLLLGSICFGWRLGITRHTRVLRYHDISWLYCKYSGDAYR